MSSGSKKPAIFDLSNKGLLPFQNFMVGVFAVVALVILAQFPGALEKTISVIFETSPIWLPLVLLPQFMHIWLHWRRAMFLMGQGSALIEIKLPKELVKSPEAMELVLTSLWQKGSATYLETYWKGKVKPWFSFEIVSEDGNIRFYMWTFKKFKELLVHQLYGQYPNIEILDVKPEDDYVHKVEHDPVNLPIWGTYYNLAKPSIYPIKTYMDFRMHENPKEEYKIEPMTPLLEYLGSMKKGETVWIQVLFQCHRKQGLKEGFLYKQPFWSDAGKAEVNKIMKRDPETKGPDVVSDTGFPIHPVMSEGDKNAITAIERNISKYPFETTIRAFYIAKAEAYNPISNTGIIGIFNQFNSKELNEIKLAWFTDFDYPWQDFRRIRRNRMEKQMLDAYKKRSFFQGPYHHFREAGFIMNAESLASIYHFPGEAATTPSFTRIPSKKVEPPSNLPT
ncbi:MAG: hypothetical protein PHS53_03500 [Candidatus Pacebacteria bacterium]|nr:hypothetical protein [Candidatus Paceibacterota bacterium]MDD5357182.1 hypothetical protein [Candidatus Paceibacterota bacterium]